MGGFEVDTEAVRTLGTQLAQICTELTAIAAPSELSDGAAGSRDVGEALGEFHAHWSGQQSQLVGNLQKLATAVETAANGYDNSDSSVAGGAGQGSQQ